jgi:hypothetical protein
LSDNARVDPPRRALDWLLGRAQTGDAEADAVHAARMSRRIRELNTEHGSAVLAYLLSLPGASLRKVSTLTGIPKDSIARWGTRPPERGPDEDQDEPELDQ